MIFNKRPRFLIWALVVALLNLILFSAAGAAFSVISSVSGDESKPVKVSSYYSDMNKATHAAQHNSQDCQNSEGNDSCSTCLQLQAPMTAAVIGAAVLAEYMKSAQSEKLVTLFITPKLRPPTAYPV